MATMLRVLRKLAVPIPVSTFTSQKQYRFYTLSFSELGQTLNEIPDIPFSARCLGPAGCTVGRPYYNSFSNAHIDIDILHYDKNKKIIENYRQPFEKKRVAVSTSIKRLFSNAINNIQSGVNIKQYEAAFGVLNNFLKNKEFHERCFMRGIQQELDDLNVPRATYLRSLSFKLPETTVAVLFAVHLLSKLPVTFDDKTLTYAVSDDYRNKPAVCPCGICDTKVIYASALIGSADLFIGRPDIILFPCHGERMVNIIYPTNGSNKFSRREMKKILQSSEGNFVEVKNNQTNLQKISSFSQVALETITFSFYNRIFREKQHEFDEEKYNFGSTLIPTIALCDRGFNICMYDSVNDIFIKNHGPPIPLFDHTGETFKISSILYLWMTINHSLFQPDFSKPYASLLKGSFGLLSRYVTADVYDRIKETMGMDIELSGRNVIKEMEGCDVIFLDDPSFSLKDKK